jgi:Carboxypeptidase regulatory-like domain/TonB-dependent Receptor Plug Domain
MTRILALGIWRRMGFRDTIVIMQHRISAAISAAALALGLAASSGAQSDVARIVGTVTDSIHARPLAGATVIATPSADVRDSVFHSAITDARGRFALGGLRPGVYTVTVEHAWIDSSGIGALPVATEARADRDATVALSIPSTSTLRRALCEASVRDTSVGVVLGAVRRAGDTTVPGATVVFKWSDFDIDRRTATVRPRQLTMSAITDAHGVYRACGLPVARTLLVQAQAGATEQSGVIEEQIGEAGVLIRDFRLAAQTVASSPDDAARAASDSTAVLGRLVLAGHVLSAGGQPIPSAQVRLFGTSRVSTTNVAGEFRLSGLPSGTQGIEVVALGFYPRRVRVEIADETAPLSIRLERAAVVLDSIRVLAKRLNGRNRIGNREFEDRVANGVGQFITEDEIAHRNAIETTDLLKLVPGVRVYGFGSEARIAAARGRTNFGNTQCPLDVFIDGLRGQQADVNTIMPDALHGIEVYTVATAPARYRVGPCGAIFLWTK